MDVAALRPHAENAEIFGARDWKAYERIKASIAEHDILQPMTVAPRPDGEGVWLLDGHDRADAARDLGIAAVPVIVRDDLDTRAKQICFMTESAKRKQFTHAQRARQERYAREAVLDEREALRDDGERITQTIARLTGQPARSIARRQRVFYGPSTTDKLKHAVDRQQVSLRGAEEIIVRAERRCGRGNDNTRRAIDAAVDKLATRYRRGPKLPVFNGGPAKARVAFWHGIEEQIRTWAIKQRHDDLTKLNEHDLRVILSEADGEIRCVVEDITRKVRRRVLANPTRSRRLETTDALQQPTLAQVNTDLAELTLPPVASMAALDVKAIKKAQRTRARELHPDYTQDNPLLTVQFQKMRAAYERLLDIAEEVQRRTSHLS